MSWDPILKLHLPDSILIDPVNSIQDPRKCKHRRKKSSTQMHTKLKVVFLEIFHIACDKIYNEKIYS